MMNTVRRDNVVPYKPGPAASQRLDLRRIQQMFYVYVMASDCRQTLSVSMTQDITTRVGNQKNDLHPRDYTSVHGIHTLVQVEEFSDLCEAIEQYNALREMDSDSLSHLVAQHNPSWSDLFDSYRA